MNASCSGVLMLYQGYPVTIQPSGVSSFSGSRYSGSPVRKLTTARSLNRPRVLPSRTSLTRSAPKVTLRMASGLAAATACTTGPASILPCGGHCSSTHWISGRFSDISFLNTATADPIFIIRRDRRPALGRQLCSFLHQHRRLHVIRRTQTESVVIALGPGDGVGQRLGGEEENLLLVGEIADGQSNIGQERTGEHRHVLARYQFVGGGLRVGGFAAVILGDDDELLAVDAAGGIDFLDRELPALAIGLGECR